jgi:hypothetical protein
MRGARRRLDPGPGEASSASRIAARHRGESEHARLARLLREAEHNRRVLDRHKRQKQQCTVRD